MDPSRSGFRNAPARGGRATRLPHGDLAWFGTVSFHSIEPTAFEEQIRFSHRGRSWLVYEQDSWRVDDGSPLHTEMGVWRMVGPKEVNTFVALTAGVDFCEGTLDGTTITLKNTSSPTAVGIERIISLIRRYRVEDEVMDYEIEMGTDRQPMQRHVMARLTRTRTPSLDSSGDATNRFLE